MPVSQPYPSDVASLAGFLAGSSPLGGAAAVAAFDAGTTEHVLVSETVNPTAVAQNVGSMVLAGGSPFASIAPLTGAVVSQQPETVATGVRSVDVMGAINTGLQYAAPSEAVAIGGGPIAAVPSGLTNKTNFIVDACFAGATLASANREGYDSVVAASSSTQVANTDPARGYQGLAEGRYTDALIGAVKNGTPVTAQDLLGQANYPVQNADAMAAVMGTLAYGAQSQTPMANNPGAVFYDPNPKGAQPDGGAEAGGSVGGDWGDGGEDGGASADAGE
jgi:hypothetical protein